MVARRINKQVPDGAARFIVKADVSTGEELKSWHPLARLLECTRCLYPILTDESENTTPFSMVPWGLVQTFPALHLLVGLPVDATDLIRARTLAEDVRPRHAIVLLSDDNIPEFVANFGQFPFCALLDVRRTPKPVELSNACWIYQRAPSFSADAIIAHWINNARSTVETILGRWEPSEIELLNQVSRHLLTLKVKPIYAPIAYPPQDCVEPNGLLANLARFGHQDAIYNPIAQPVDLENLSLVQSTQLQLADKIREARNADQIPTFLIAPSTNPHLVRKFETVAKRRPGLGELTDAVINEHSYIFHTSGSEFAAVKFADIQQLLLLKTMERRWIDSMALAGAAARGGAVFRTPQIPARLFRQLEHLGQMTWSEKTIHRSMIKWERMCSELTAAIGADLLGWISQHTRRLTAISDLPLEWCTVNGVPLGFLVPICRVPLALGACTATYLRDFRPPAVWRTVEDLRVLFVDGHTIDDDFRRFPEHLAERSKQCGFTTQLSRAGRESELVAAINSFEPHLLILSAHGIVDTEDGALIALADEKTPLRLDGLSWKPDAAIVSACRGEAVVRTFGSPASNLYAAGIRAVLGSYLNLTEPHASMMVSAILVNLRDAIAGVRPKLTNWHDLVTMTLIMRRPVDILVAASRWHERRGRTGSPMELFARYTEWHNRNSDRNIATSWSSTLDQLVTLAEGTQYKDAMVAMRHKRAFRPESMFYTHIGEPHRILLGTSRLRVTR